MVEICANSVQSAIYAEKGGADRIELCQNLNEGGTTPSYGTIRYCVQNLAIPVFVLIRPRSGDFCYSETEYDVMKQDVLTCKELGVAGVVTGFLHPDFSVDTGRTKEIVTLASPMKVTFHRAFDLSRNWQTNLEAIISCGCHRILSSGCRQTALEGSNILHEMQLLAHNRITILAGSGITPQNVTELILKTGVSEIHASCKGKRGTQRNTEDMLMDNSNVEWIETEEKTVRELVEKTRVCFYKCTASP